MNTNDVLHVALTAPEPGVFGPICENVKLVLEIIALFFAGIFFAGKLVAGYFYVNLSLKLRCDRTQSQKPGIDLLVVNMALKKGERGSIRIHDAQARITYGESHLKKDYRRFCGFERASYKTDKITTEVCGERSTFDRKKINWELRSKRSPFLRITPGEETEYSCVFEVPKDETCMVEVAVMGRLGMPFVEDLMKVGQWKASAVSLPGAAGAKRGGDSRD